MRDFTPSPSTTSATRLLVLLGLAVAGAVSAATAASVYVATDPPRRAAQRGTGAWLHDPSIASRSASLTSLLDSLIAPLGASVPLDSSRLFRFVALTGKASPTPSWIAEPDSAPAPASPHTVSRETLTLFRAWARSAPLPAFWGYRHGFGQPVAIYELPLRRAAVFRSLWRANAADADSALSHGHTDAALERARENLAGARHLLGQPFAIDAMIGVAQLRESARLLARVAASTQDPRLTGAAERLQMLAHAHQPIPPGNVAWLMRAAADPASDSLVRLAADRSAHPARRLLMTELLPAGACFNPREMLFGISSERRATMDRLLAALSDVPRLDELRGPMLGQFRYAEGGSPWAPPQRVRGVGERALEVVLPDGLVARIRWCRRVV